MNLRDKAWWAYGGLLFGFLVGCVQDPVWVLNKAWANYTPQKIEVTVSEDMTWWGKGRSGDLQHGCALRIKSTNVCHVRINSTLARSEQECVLGHEVKHCMGWDHPPGYETKRVEC